MCYYYNAYATRDEYSEVLQTCREYTMNFPVCICNSRRKICNFDHGFAFASLSDEGVQEIIDYILKSL